MSEDETLRCIVNGRTDLCFDYLSAGLPADSRDASGVSLLQWCAYYGDVSAIRRLLAAGEELASLGRNCGLNAAAFHGHWRLCEFLVESGADANQADEENGETPLHAALCKPNRPTYEMVVEVLLAAGADPNANTKAGAPTECFMRDARTRSETPLHRAAAFGSERTIGRLKEAGARLDAKDMDGDSPLSWASWHLRPDPILRALCYAGFSIRPDRRPMELSLLGSPKS